MGLVRIAGPTIEPISLEEAKAHLRVDHVQEDGLIGSLIIAAREYVEQFTRRALIEQQWRLTLDAFPTRRGAIVLAMPPLVSVDAVKYLDLEGAEGTLVENTDYLVDDDSQPGRILPAWEVAWPETRGVPNAVTVEFTAGYGQTAEAVPQGIKQAMLLMLGHWYLNREAVVTGTIATEIPISAEALCWQYRDYRFS